METTSAILSAHATSEKIVLTAAVLQNFGRLLLQVKRLNERAHEVYTVVAARLEQSLSHIKHMHKHR